MKKILLFIFVVLILFHSGLYLYSFHYQNPNGTFEFYDVTATDISQGKTDHSSESPEIQNWYINPELEELLCQCEFKSVNAIQATVIAAQAKNADQIGILFTSGKKSLFRNREYVLGRLLFFDDDRAYYAAMYRQEDMKFSATGWSYTVYEVDAPQLFFEQYHNYLRDVSNSNILSIAARFALQEYEAQLTKPFSVILHSMAIIFAVACFLHKKQKKALEEYEG